MKDSPKPWKPVTTNCCTTENETVLGHLSRYGCRCRPSRSDAAAGTKNVVPPPSPSFRRVSFLGLSRSSYVHINEDIAHAFGTDLFDFKLSELRGITQNFSSNLLLGQGGFGTVHKGYVDDGMKPGLRA